MRQIITMIRVTHVQKDFKIQTLIKHLLIKYQIFMKLPQISHIHNNHNFSSIIRHVNATKSYLHFDRFAEEAILCSNFFCFSLFLDVLFLS